MPKNEKDNQQEVIDTVLIQGDQIPIREENPLEATISLL